MATTLGQFELNSRGGGKATSKSSLIFKKTGLDDNTATDILTVTVPNGNHAACIQITCMATTGGADAFEGTTTRTYILSLARTTGAAVVAGLSGTSTVTIAAAFVAGGSSVATLTLGTSAISGAVGATNTFTVQVTADSNGDTNGTQVVVVADLINAEDGGVTIAAA